MTTWHFHLTYETVLDKDTAWAAVWHLLSTNFDPQRVELSPPRKILSEDHQDSQAERTSPNGLR